ncbi:MAG TPA: hypothetical protein VJ624_06445 [Thermodesulfobacteriota bacterium]|nr:hypothetical protein [Thermodesulfobacteriota bacterium]
MEQLHKIGVWCVVTVILLSIACSATIQSQGNQTKQQESMTQKDINAVLKDHDKELLAIPGVVGVYVGLLPDDKTPCLKVMVVKETEDLKSRIPKSIEGYPVLIEESGVIRPL